MRLAFVLAAATLFGCASGTSNIDAGRHPDGGLDGQAGDLGACDPSCGSGNVCIGGRCVPTASDGDHDGVPTAADCDDTNAGIGGIAERACSSACGPGVEQCMDGLWMPCSAPAACDCHDGDAPRMLACGNCGMQTQVCTAGRWVNSGACTGERDCMPGSMDVGAACGMCGHQVRTCQLDCTWGASSCGGGGECAAGAMDSASRACGTCGTQTQTRTCDTTCHWGAYTDWSGCAGEGTCTPGTTRGCPNGDSCGHEVCSSSCNWGGCTPTRACLRIRPGTSGPEGNNWQCCGAHGYQFCCPSCDWCGCTVPAPGSYGC